MDGRSVGYLGMKWSPEKDVLQLGTDPMTLNHKVQGKKCIPVLDVTSEEGITQAFQQGAMSKAGILSRVAEMYDPDGLWEPLKVQMKIAFTALNGKEWRDPVGPEMAEIWAPLFTLLDELRAVSVPRRLFPDDTARSAPVRLIGLADAGLGCGGAAVYAGVELTDGSWSCQLVASKSKLMKDTVPRNELSAIGVLADLMLKVQRALGDRVKEVFYYSDSEVGICWVLNPLAPEETYTSAKNWNFSIIFFYGLLFIYYCFFIIII
jgi:hypothetical protein